MATSLAGGHSLSKKVTEGGLFLVLGGKCCIMDWGEKMLRKNAENRGQLEFVSLESMVPQGCLLWKTDEAIDFKRIYEFVEDM